MLTNYSVENAARIALQNFIQSRDFLGLKLSNAMGCLDDDELDKLADEYLFEYPISDDELLTNTEALVRILGPQVDTEIVSTAFRCGLDRAERALLRVARSISEDQPIAIWSGQK